MYTSSKTPEYLAKFPLGKVPGFERADNGFRLVESGAILQYVAESGPRRDQLLGATPEDRARNAQWVLFNDLQLEQCLYPLLGWRMGYVKLADVDAAKEAQAVADMKRYLAFAEAHLSGGSSVDGEKTRVWFVHADADAGPSTADLVVGSVFAILCAYYVDAAMRPEYPGLVRHLERLRGLPVLADLYALPMIEKRQEREDAAAAAAETKA